MKLFPSIGEFINKDQYPTMIKAKASRIQAYKCQNGLMEIKVQTPKSDYEYEYDISTSTRISKTVNIF